MPRPSFVASCYGNLRQVLIRLYSSADFNCDVWKQAKPTLWIFALLFNNVTIFFVTRQRLVTCRKCYASFTNLAADLTLTLDTTKWKKVNKVVTLINVVFCLFYANIVMSKLKWKIKWIWSWSWLSLVRAFSTESQVPRMDWEMLKYPKEVKKDYLSKK